MRVCSPFGDTFSIILGIALLSIFASKQTSMASSPRECQRSAQNLISKLLNGMQRENEGSSEEGEGGVYFVDTMEFCEIDKFDKIDKNVSFIRIISLVVK